MARLLPYGYSMDFRDYAAKETSALITRLLATQAEVSLQQLRALRDALDEAARAFEDVPPADKQIQDLVGRLNTAAGNALRAATQRVRDESRVSLDAVRAELDASQAENAKLAASLAELEAESEVLHAELRNEKDRTDSVDRDLVAAREHQEHLETARVAAEAACREEEQARSSVEEELRETRDLLDTALAEAARLGERLEEEAADKAALKAELTEAREAHEQLEAVRAEAEAIGAQEAQAREAAERELQQLRAELNTAIADVDVLRSQLDAAVADQSNLTADLSTAHDELRTVKDQCETLTAQLESSNTRADGLEAAQTEHEETIRQLEVKLDTSLEAEAALREQLATTQEENAGARGETETMRGEVDRMLSLLDAAVLAVDDLAHATTVDDTLVGVLKQLSTEYPRVALFRVKANRLEGAHQIGFDHATDVSKIVIPLTMDSLLTRACSSGLVEILTDGELADSNGVPFGGTPTTALALPVVLDGATLAVVYADDSGEPVSERGPVAAESSSAFAKLLVRQTAVLLMRLTHELKAMSELRDYATLLLQEAQQMYEADAEAGKTDEELRSRLNDTVECARQLYAQRAAMEGPAASAVLDEQIAAAIDQTPESSFARDLAAVVGHTTRSGSHRAEAS